MSPNFTKTVRGGVASLFLGCAVLAVAPAVAFAADPEDSSASIYNPETDTTITRTFPANGGRPTDLVEQGNTLAKHALKPRVRVPAPPRAPAPAPPDYSASGYDPETNTTFTRTVQGGRRTDVTEAGNTLDQHAPAPAPGSPTRRGYSGALYDPETNTTRTLSVPPRGGAPVRGSFRGNVLSRF